MDRRTKILLFRWLRPHHYIILMALCTFSAFIIGYGISVGYQNGKKKVYYLFPYISDTGTKPPASCYFGLLLSLSSVFAAFTMYFRHKYLENFFIQDHRMHIINDISLFLGGLSAFGIMLVANFQETNVISIHLIGAMLTFCLGNVYCLIHNYFSYKTIPAGLSTKSMFYLRCVLTFFSISGLIMTIIGASIARNQAAGTSVIKIYWTSNDKGYAAHLVSTFSEWVMAICFVVYFLTFYGEFTTINSSLTLASNAGSGMTFNTEDV